MKPITEEVAVFSVRDRWSTYPSQGLTPERLAQIFKEADAGDITRQAELFSEMEEKDPHLFSCIQTRKLAVVGCPWEVVAVSDKRQDRKVADFVRENLLALVDFEDDLLDLLDAIGKGFAISEIMWEVSGGEVRIADLVFRPQKKFTFWESLEPRLITDGDIRGTPLPPNKFIVHIYRARSGLPNRGGLLRIVAWMYLFKNYSIKDWITFAEVYGMPIRIGKYSPSASSDDKETLIEAVRLIGHDFAAVISESTDIELKEVARSTTDVHKALAEFCNREMSKAILGQTLTTEVGERGSYAAARVHGEVRQDLLEADARALAKTIRWQLIKPLVAFNFGQDVLPPRFVIRTEPPQDLKAEVERDKVLIVDIGLPVAKEYLYSKYGIPQPKPEEETLQGPPLAMKEQLPKAFVGASRGGIEERLRGAEERALRLDGVIAEGVEKALGSYEALVAKLKDIIARTSLRTIAGELKTLDWDFVRGVGSALADVLLEGYDQGRSAVVQKARRMGLALQEGVGITFGLPPQDAIDFLRLQAFSVAHVENEELLGSLKGLVAKALEQGWTEAEFREEAEGLFDTMGVTRIAKHHIDLVFRQNAVTAYQAGKFYQMSSPDMRGQFPLWEYLTVGDDKVRPAHRAMHGFKAPPDDPVWRVWYPPNGFNCRCDVEPLHYTEVQAEGLRPTGKVPVLPETGRPARPDRGFEHNPGEVGTIFRRWLERKGKTEWEPEDYGLKPFEELRPSAEISGLRLYKALDEFREVCPTEVTDFHGVRRVVNPEEIWEKFLEEDPARAGWVELLRDTLEHPDEVWGNWDAKGNVGLSYQKKVRVAGKDYLFQVIVDSSEGGTKVRTFYPIRHQEAQKKRRGILLFLAP